MKIKPKISIVAALAKNRVIGGGNTMLWHIKEDFKRFKELTSGHPIIMGRKTFESIGRPLPLRTNIVISRDTKQVADGIVMAASLEEAISKAAATDEHEVFIIGGGQIYKEALPIADKLYLTLIDLEVSGDTYFPDYSEFSKITYKKECHDENCSYTFLELERN